MTIKIKEKDYKLGGRMRAMLLWEAAMNRPFDLVKCGDMLLYFYCLILAGKNEETISWEWFVDACEEDPTIFARMTALITDAEKAFGSIESEEEGEGSKKK